MRDKKEVLQAAMVASRQFGRYSRGVTLFRTGDGPAFIKVHVCRGSDAAKEALKTISMLGGEAVFSLLPNNGDYVIKGLGK